jgi:heme/copper-type cytochrome/quinol oxidase subunit 4
LVRIMQFILSLLVFLFISTENRRTLFIVGWVMIIIMCVIVGVCTIVDLVALV